MASRFAAYLDRKRLVDLWSVGLPRWLDPKAPALADALADSAWIAPWLPAITAYAPLAALAWGLLTPAFVQVYSESLLFMAIAIGGAILSRTVGLMLLVGYVAGSLLAGLSNLLFGDTVRYGGGLIVSYVLLAIPTVMVPTVAHGLVPVLPPQWAHHRTVRLLTRGAFYPVACALLVYVWCQGMIAMIRPVFTFVHASPTTEAIAQVQQRWDVLVKVAALAAFARILLEELADRSHRRGVVQELQTRRWAGAQRGVALSQRLPAGIRIVLSAAVATLLLAGTYERSWNALLVAAVTAGLLAWRARLVGRVPEAWSAAMNRIPPLFRFAAATLIGYVLAYVVLRMLWSSGSLQAVMLGSLLTLAAFTLLFPGQPRPKLIGHQPSSERAEELPAPTSTARERRSGDR